MCVRLILLILNSFWNSLLILFLSSLFYSEKISPETFIFCFCSVPFLCHFLSFNIFPCFLSSLFLWSSLPFIHLFIPFCFSPFFFSLLSPFFLYFSISCFLNFFLHRRCCVSSFCFNSFFFCLSLLILISLFSYFFSRFLLHLRLCFSFFQKKKIKKFLWSMFWRWNYVFIFLNPPVICVISRVFFLLASSFSLFVLCFLVFRFFIVTFLDHRYFSWFSFINLFLGLFKKIALFSWKKVQKYHSSFCSRFEKKSLLFFFFRNQFLL